MTEVTFIDSSGLKAILSFGHSRAGNGRVLVVDPAVVVGPVFSIISLDEHAPLEVRQTFESRV
jgi:anti-anti-sigma regulatory factor